MNLKTEWIKHLKDNNMTYCQHFKFAFSYGILCLSASFLLIIHAIFPCWFQTTGSNLVRTMAVVFKHHTKN